jgi:hypothetical protein
LFGSLASLGGVKQVSTLEIFALLCNFLHRAAIKEFPEKSTIHN